MVGVRGRQIERRLRWDRQLRWDRRQTGAGDASSQRLHLLRQLRVLRGDDALLFVLVRRVRLLLRVLLRVVRVVRVVAVASVVVTRAGARCAAGRLIGDGGDGGARPR